MQRKIGRLVREAGLSNRAFFISDVGSGIVCELDKKDKRKGKEAFPLVQLRSAFTAILLTKGVPLPGGEGSRSGELADRSTRRCEGVFCYRLYPLL
eukprot:2487154-Rhodomonas_salina.3